MDHLPAHFVVLRDYWLGLAGGQAPERDQIDVSRLKPMLAYLLLVEFDDHPFQVRFRLTGTAIDRMTGMNITGHYLHEFATGEFEPAIRYIEACYRNVWESGNYFIGHYDWPIEDGVIKRTMMGLFPLRVRGQVRQCLSIEHYGPFEAERRPIDWRPALAAESAGQSSTSVGEWIGDEDRVVPLRTRR